MNVVSCRLYTKISEGRIKESKTWEPHFYLLPPPRLDHGESHVGELRAADQKIMTPPLTSDLHGSLAITTRM